MDERDVRAVALRALANLAPEADLSLLTGDELLQEVLDLDSFDFLRFVEAVNDATGVNIPEIDYPRVATLAGVVDYVASHAVG